LIGRKLWKNILCNFILNLKFVSCLVVSREAGFPIRHFESIKLQLGTPLRYFESVKLQKTPHNIQNQINPNQHTSHQCLLCVCFDFVSAARTIKNLDSKLLLATFVML